MANNSEPVMVLYKSNLCGHCKVLTNIWDNVMNEVKVVYPKLRFFVLTSPDNTGVFDENHAPKSLLKYGRWFPMVLLVPGKVWDSAMNNLGPKNPVDIKDGVQIINAAWDGDTLKYEGKYDIRKPAEFVRWLKDAHENADFKRVQNSTDEIVVPRKTGTGNIAPLLAPLNKPIGGEPKNKYVPAASLDGAENICSMRLISRPK